MFVMPIARAAHRPAYNGHARDLGRAFDRLFDRALDDSVPKGFASDASRQPAIDLRETDQHYSVQMDVPGVAKEDVKVTIDGKRVAIETAPRKAADTAEGEQLLLRERSAAGYSRSFLLPVEIDEAASQAKLEHGVLTLTLAKKLKPATRLTIG